MGVKLDKPLLDSKPFFFYIGEISLYFLERCPESSC